MVLHFASFESQMVSGACSVIFMSRMPILGTQRCSVCLSVFIDSFDSSEVELISAGFNLETDGKVPKVVCRRADAWLRKAAQSEQRALVALSEPTDAESVKIGKLLKS